MTKTANHAAREKLKRALSKRKRGRTDDGGNTRSDFHLNPQRGDGSKIEYLGESRAKFTYPCGHHEIKNWGKGNVTKRMPPAGVQMLTEMWNRNGVHVPKCTVCWRKGIGVKAQFAVARQNEAETIEKIINWRDHEFVP